MSEQLSGGGPTSDSGLVCPWCSAALPSAGLGRCPTCGAALKEPDATAVPGVTQIDVEAILKSRAPAPKPRGIIGWLAGEYETEAPEERPAGTLEPPDEAVRREIIRLELAALEAEVLARQAEVVAEVATETGRPVDLETLGLGEGADEADAEGPGNAGEAESETPESEAADDAAGNTADNAAGKAADGAAGTHDDAGSSPDPVGEADAEAREG